MPKTYLLFIWIWLWTWTKIHFFWCLYVYPRINACRFLFIQQYKTDVHFVCRMLLLNCWEIVAFDTNVSYCTRFFVTSWTFAHWNTTQKHRWHYIKNRYWRLPGLRDVRIVLCHIFCKSFSGLSIAVFGSVLNVTTFHGVEIICLMWIFCILFKNMTRTNAKKNNERRYERKFETIWLVNMFWKAHRSQCIQVLHITILYFSQLKRSRSHMVQLMQYKRTIIQHSFLNTVLCKRCKRRAVMHNWENWFFSLSSLCRKITRTFKCLQRKMKLPQFKASSFHHLFSIISFTFDLFPVSILFLGTCASTSRGFECLNFQMRPLMFESVLLCGSQTINDHHIHFECISKR